MALSGFTAWKSAAERSAPAVRWRDQDWVLTGSAELRRISGLIQRDWPASVPLGRKMPPEVPVGSARKPSLRALKRTILPAARRVRTPGVFLGPKRKSDKSQSAEVLPEEALPRAVEVAEPRVRSPVRLMISTPGARTSLERRFWGSAPSRLVVMVLALVVERKVLASL